MFNLFQARIIASLLLLLFPLITKADAINPLLNLFTKETAGSAATLTVFIILIESTLLRKFVKTVSWRTHVWRATVFNTISSAFGSIAAVLFFKEQLDWRMSELYIPMFILTLITETPALIYLYRRDNLGWLRSLKLSVGINIASYVSLFVGQIGYFLIVLSYAGFADEQTIKNWTNATVLNGESGYIYTVKNLANGWPEKNILNRYDVENKKWDIVDPGLKNGLDSSEWDTRGNILAVVEKIDDFSHSAKDQVDPSILILDIRNFSKISEIKSKGGDMRISPDLSKLAVFEFDRQLEAPKDDESHFMLGAAYKLRIYDIKSGKLLFESPRPAIDEGLTWLANSTEVVFASLRDESLFSQKEKFNSMGYGRDYSKLGQFPIDLFIYNMETNSVRFLTEGIQPNRVDTTNEITYLKEVKPYKHEIWKLDANLTNSQFVMKVEEPRYAPSPSGKKYLLRVPQQQPFGSNDFLAVSTTNDKDKKFILEPRYRSLFRWVEK